MMKVAVLILFLVTNAYSKHIFRQKRGLSSIGVPQERSSTPILEIISQRLDHFNIKDERTWYMRYYSNNQFYIEGGPIFIYLGGEWEITPDFLTTGLMFDMADIHDGYMFHTEHRYYGASQPTEDHSTENLQYLSIDQALGDLAYFIEQKKNTIPGAANSKVVIVGASYSATMAVWFRIKYPHLVDAAWASSAPLRATTNFYEYYQHVSDEIERVDSQCYENIRQGMEVLMDNLQTPEGVQNMSTIFNTCDTIDTTEPEISYFLSAFPYPWTWSIQHAEGSSTIQDECDYFNSLADNNFERLVRYMDAFYGGECLNNLEKFIRVFSKPYSTDDFERQWLYQICSELGWYHSGTGRQPFANFSNEFILEMCDAIYSIDAATYNRAVERTNVFYGSVDPAVTKVVFVYGTIDPWMSMGVQSDVNDQAPVILIPEASHCAEMGSFSEWDSFEMFDAKMRIMDLIEEWIS